MKLGLIFFMLAATLIGMALAGDGDLPDGTVHGHVYDAGTKKPLPRAFVYCNEISAKDATDKEGYYAIENSFSPSKTYKMDCTMYGYKPINMSITKDKSGKAEADFYLESGIAASQVSAANILNLILKDTATRSLRLNLIQSEDAVMGNGELI